MAKADTKPKLKKPKITDKEQSERFIEAALELGVDESGEHFDRAFDRIVKPGKAARKGAA